MIVSGFLLYLQLGWKAPGFQARPSPILILSAHSSSEHQHVAHLSGVVIPAATLQVDHKSPKMLRDNCEKAQQINSLNSWSHGLIGAAHQTNFLILGHPIFMVATHQIESTGKKGDLMATTRQNTHHLSASSKFSCNLSRFGGRGSIQILQSWRGHACWCRLSFWGVLIWDGILPDFGHYPTRTFERIRVWEQIACQEVLRLVCKKPLLPSHSWHFVQRSRAQRANSPTLAPTSTIKGASVLKFARNRELEWGWCRWTRHDGSDRWGVTV